LIQNEPGPQSQTKKQKIVTCRSILLSGRKQQLL